MVLASISSTPPLDADALVARARAEKRLDFDLGPIDPDTPATRQFCLGIADLRARSYLGFRFTCTVPVGITADGATLLGRAGVVAVTLNAQAGQPMAERPPAYLAQLQTVRLLHEAGIAVSWQIVWDDAMRNTASAGAVERIFAAATNLPAPAMVAASPECAADNTFRRLDAAARSWHSHFRPSALTFARGPGFLRIRDRRASRPGCKFYTLKAQQAEIMLLCTHIRSVADIADLTPGIPAERLSAFLSRMEDEQLIARHGDDYLALPTRRTLGERWSSEVV